MILVAIAALLGVVIGLALPKISPSIGEITGEYIASGPAADALNGLQVDDRPDSTGYDRDSFGFRATDDDGDGCDVRDVVLARDLTDVIFSAAKRCQVSSGTLADPYTGKTILFVRGRNTSAAVQIDHVVALANAWQSGARDWTTAQRYRFGNDPYNLLAVDGPANQDKGSAPPLTGFPPTAHAPRNRSPVSEGRNRAHRSTNAAVRPTGESCGGKFDGLLQTRCIPLGGSSSAQGSGA